MLDSYTAGICSAVLGLLPMVLLFEKSVMLEIPWLALEWRRSYTGSDIWNSIKEDRSICPRCG
jgi:hypothetical protein